MYRVNVIDHTDNKWRSTPWYNLEFANWVAAYYIECGYVTSMEKQRQ